MSWHEFLLFFPPPEIVALFAFDLEKTKLPRLTLGSIAIPRATWPRLVAQLIHCVSSTLSIPGVVCVALVEHAFGYQDVGHRAGGHLEV